MSMEYSFSFPFFLQLMYNAEAKIALFCYKEMNSHIRTLTESIQVAVSAACQSRDQSRPHLSSCTTANTTKIGMSGIHGNQISGHFGVSLAH